MKKICFVFLVLAAMVSCGRQDTVYKPFIKEGGYVYPAKPLELKATSGYQRVILEWQAPMDPSIRVSKLFWDNYTDSLEFSISDYKDGVLTAEVKNLDDRSYTFDVVNYDSKGNKSLATEITTTPFGESWLLSHAERSILSAVMDGDDAVITMTKATDEMVATQFRYKKADGTEVLSDYLEPEQVEIRLPNALKGKKLEYKSAFLPESGKDTVWFLSWQKSMNPILYKPDTGNWTVEATKGQVYNTFTADKIFDGLITSAGRWHSSRTSSTAKLFPKVLAIDTGTAEGEEYTFANFIVHQSTSGQTYRYIREVLVFIGDQPFDPNDSNPLENFGTPVFKETLQRTETSVKLDFRPVAKGRYIALVFTNSYSGSGYIDLWELEPFGYLASEVE